MGISRQDVEYLGKLSRIQLTSEELDRFAAELDAILGYVEKLKAAKTESVPPTSHVLELTNVDREDQIQPSLPTDQALDNAPDREGPFFKVPQIIDSA